MMKWTECPEHGTNKEMTSSNQVNHPPLNEVGLSLNSGKYHN